MSRFKSVFITVTPSELELSTVFRLVVIEPFLGDLGAVAFLHGKTTNVNGLRLGPNKLDYDQYWPNNKPSKSIPVVVLDSDWI